MGSLSVILGSIVGPPDCGLGAGASYVGALGRVIGPLLDRVGAGEHLLGPQACGGHRVHRTGGRRIVEFDLLIVEECLMLVASALGVIEDVLRRGTACLREICLGLAPFLIGALRRAERSSTRVVVEPRLLLVEIVLLAIPDRLLTVYESLLQAGDALIGVQALL